MAVFAPVWTHSQVVETINARWSEGGVCPGDTFEAFQARCLEWWSADPLVRNADGHVAFQSEMQMLERLPQSRQLEAYDEDVLKAMADRLGVSTDRCRLPDLRDRIFRAEFLHNTGARRKPQTSCPDRQKKGKGDPRAPFKPPKPAPSNPVPHANVVELEDSQDFG